MKETENIRTMPKTADIRASVRFPLRGLSGIYAKYSVHRAVGRQEQAVGGNQDSHQDNQAESRGIVNQERHRFLENPGGSGEIVGQQLAEDSLNRLAVGQRGKNQNHQRHQWEEGQNP